MGARKQPSKKRIAPAKGPTPITELELMSIETARLHLSRLRADVRKAEAKLEQDEAAIMARLKEGAAIQGNRTAVIEAVTGACRPKWQELYLKHMSAEHGLTEALATEKAKAAYPPKSEDVLVIGVKPEAV